MGMASVTITLVLWFAVAVAALSSFPPEENPRFIEGDIVPLAKQFKGNWLQRILLRNLVASRQALWPNKTLVYELSDEFHPAEKMWIRYAVSALANKTCVRFIERTDEEDRMFVRNLLGCASPVGYHPGRVVMYLSLPSCIKWGTIQHEFLHALGFWHEHTRPDRDNYVEVQWENILRGMQINFAARSWTEAGSVGLPYDFGSVMHYRALAFSRDKVMPTIVPLKEGVTIGQRERFSPLDLAKLNRLYECSAEFYRGDDIAEPISADVAPVTSETNNEIPWKSRAAREAFDLKKKPSTTVNPENNMARAWDEAPRRNDSFSGGNNSTSDSAETIDDSTSEEEIQVTQYGFRLTQHTTR